MNYTPSNVMVKETSESRSVGCNPFRAISSCFSQLFFPNDTQEQTVIALKKWEKSPKSFSFKTLPLVLKFLVLDCMDFDESFHLLKTDRTLRRHILRYGPFRGKVDQIRVTFDAFIEIEDHKFALFPHFTLGVHLNRRSLAKFLISDQIVKTGDVSLPTPKLGRFFWTLVNRTRLCKVVSIEPGFFHFRGNPEMTDQAIALKLEAQQESEVELRKVFGENRFLPRLKQTAIFRFHSAGMVSTKIFLDNFDRQVNDSFFLEIQWEDVENRDAQDYISSLMDRPNYQDCKYYGFDQKPITPQLWKAFSKTNMRMLMSEGLSWEDFKQSLKVYLELGIPSKDEDAVVEVRSRAIGLSSANFQWETSPEEIFEELMDLIYHFKGLEKIDEVAVEARGIIEFDRKFIERNKEHFESPFKEEKVTYRHEDKAIYKKKMHSERDCIFMATITEKKGENFGYLDVRTVMKYLPTYHL